MTAVRAAGAAAECRPPGRPGSRPRPVRGYASGKDDYLRRLRKVEGQVRGLQKMIGNDAWCPDVVIQVASATRAMQETDTPRAMTTAAYQVTGMTCEHCVHAVSDELKNLDGVSDVTVLLHPGGQSAVMVTSGAPLPAEAVAAALDEAGDYRLAG
jgi:copper chaperone